MKKFIAAILFGLALVQPGVSQIKSNTVSIQVVYIVPETVKMQPVISDDKKTATVTVSWNLIEPPKTLAINYNGRLVERECNGGNGEPCTTPLTAQGTATFEIELDGSQRADFSLVVV